MQDQVKRRIRCKIREYRSETNTLTDVSVVNLVEDIANIVDENLAEVLTEAMEFGEILDAVGLWITTRPPVRANMR